METNLEKINDIAKTLLYTDVHFDDTFGFLVHHPFFQNSIYPVRKNGEMDLLNLAEETELSVARNAVEHLIDKVKNVFEYLMLVTKPYIPAFFKYAYPFMSEKDYALFLSEMWTFVEFPNSDENIKPYEFVKLFSKAKKEHLMSEEDMAYYNSLPDTVTVYRGIQKNAKVKALSWTTNLETAMWFSNRWSHNGDVYKAEIDKKDILAYFNTRGEHEIVVNFKKLKNIQKI